MSKSLPVCMPLKHCTNTLPLPAAWCVKFSIIIKFLLFISKWQDWCRLDTTSPHVWICVAIRGTHCPICCLYCTHTGPSFHLLSKCKQSDLQYSQHSMLFSVYNQWWAWIFHTCWIPCCVSGHSHSFDLLLPCCYCVWGVFSSKLPFSPY